MELADVLDSKSSGSDTVRVRPPLPAPKKDSPSWCYPFLLPYAVSVEFDAKSACGFGKGSDPRPQNERGLPLSFLLPYAVSVESAAEQSELPANKKRGVASFFIYIAISAFSSNNFVMNPSTSLKPMPSATASSP